MKIILDNVIIQSEFNVTYYNDIVNTLKENEKRIFNFFRIKKLSNKVTIFIIGFNEFKKFIINKYGSYKDYIRADTDFKTNTIRILSIEDQIKYTIHKDTSLSSFLKVILHEFVHICNDEVNNDYNKVIWFNEGLATNLSNQDYNLVDLSDCDFESLKNNWYNYGKNKYSYAHTIVNYVLNNYSDNIIYELICNSELLRIKSNQIFKEAALYTK